ncbi:type II and III secretion system protein family protein [Acinetobacter boissieri]|uniref:Pilus assembly protein CpaC n=1 Tax=Acinetobacter boissieri TaxID=1219383 RepID=A0A1G6JUK0_9GAMM|nr:pilus assembly protein N-terminal domain-containing protein [Acinetobacter boissieri]SDC22075.1 pilus assembly protein CpaC [Acinetobacter boissieri]
MNSLKKIVFLSTSLFTMNISAAIDNQLYVGETIYLNDPNITDILIGNNSIVKAKKIGKKGIALTGVSSGDTTIKLWNGNSYKSSDFHVSPTNIKQTFLDIKQNLGNIPNLNIQQIGDNIVLQGGNLSTVDKERIDTYSLLLKNVINITKLKDNSTQEKQKMIYLDVRILEISSSNTKQIGIKWNTASIDGPKFGLMGDFKKSSGFTVESNTLSNNISTLPAISPFQTYFGLASFIDSKVNLLQENGIAKILARPLLSCKNGGNATFLSGGQVPYQSSSATGTPSIEFKDYGIKLDIQPSISEGGIMAKILAEVSTIDQSVQVSGVPGFLTRRTETEFVVGQGQTLVLSGLIGSEKSSSQSSVPGLGKIPLLGNLFKSKSNNEKNNELVFFVTPYIYDEDDKHKLDKVINQSNKLVQEEMPKTKALSEVYEYQGEKVQ